MSVIREKWVTPGDVLYECPSGEMGMPEMVHSNGFVKVATSVRRAR